MHECARACDSMSVREAGHIYIWNTSHETRHTKAKLIGVSHVSTLVCEKLRENWWGFACEHMSVREAKR